jgi:hypothetical protein
VSIAKSKIFKIFFRGGGLAFPACAKAAEKAIDAGERMAEDVSASGENTLLQRVKKTDILRDVRTARRDTLNEHTNKETKPQLGAVYRSQLPLLSRP